MRTVFLGITIFSILASQVQAADYNPRWSDLPCQICIERPEEQGILNIRETTIAIDGKQAFLMIGGQASCAYVAPGKHSIFASSYDPYDPNSKDPKAWLSNKMTIDLENVKRVELELRRAKDMKENQWEIEQVQ